MPMRVISWVPAAFAAIMLGANCAALAADDCLAGPNRPPAQGGHWYYRIDHVSNRKCWYLVEPGVQTPTAEAPDPQPASESRPQPTFGSFFSSLTGGFTSAGAQPDTANNDARTLPTARPGDPRNDEVAPGRQPRVTRHPDAQAALIPKQHRAAQARPPAEPADERSAPQLNQAARDALFQEFLRWKDRRTP
jgi:hypothetical protein